MSLNDSLSDLERSKLAVWDYPVSTKYTTMWQSMKEAGLPMTIDAALERVRKSPSLSEGYAFLGKISKHIRSECCFINSYGWEADVSWRLETVKEVICFKAYKFPL